MLKSIKKPKLNLFSLFALTLILTASLTGCGKPEPTPTPTKTPRPVVLVTATPVQPTATDTSLPSPTLTHTPSVTATPTDTPTPTETPTPTLTPTPTRDPHENPLTGVMVDDPAKLQRRPVMVRIGNDPVIRPQTGLGDADIVYEDIMDGWGVTRYTGVFLANAPENVGPVRSARLINLEIVPQYHAALAHSGASDAVRYKIKESGIVDLDEYFHSTPYYYKKNKDWRGRLFTGIPTIREYLQSRGQEQAVQLRGFEFSPEPPPGANPAKEVTIPYPKNCVVTYKYDADKGAYVRYIVDELQTDAATDEPIAPSNVVIIFAEHQDTDIVEDSLGNTSINIVLTGTGKFFLFRDGLMWEGTWERTEREEMMRFLDAEGKPIPFKPGQTWMQLVPLDYEIEVK